MIITCINCVKHFDVESRLIPENGRLLECNKCKHKWFFKKEIKNDPIDKVKFNITTNIKETSKNDVKPLDIERTENIELLDEPNNNNFEIEKILINDDKPNTNKYQKDDQNIKVGISKNKKNYSILTLTIVFITTFAALIIFLDTFQGPMGKIVPNIEFLLYNLYESINDILLFFVDLI